LSDRPDREDGRSTPGGSDASKYLEIARGRVRSKGLHPFDLEVFRRLLEIGGRGARSCWTSKRHLAKHLGRCERTIWRSLRRLIAAEQICRVRVAKPDPDDARNRTGWRFVFVGSQESPAAQGHEETDRSVTRIARARFV
jgi:hypothetical protein